MIKEQPAFLSQVVFFINEMQLTPEQKEFIRIYENEDVRDLALRKSIFTGLDMSFLLAQILGRQIAKNKIPSWYANSEIVYPVHLSLEQASSEITTQYKASLFSKQKNKFVDLTGGMGVDFSFLSRYFKEAVYVEQNHNLCELAESNFRALQLTNVQIKNEEAESFLQQMSRADVVFVDPSRRDGMGRKVFRIEDCSPNVAEIKSLLLKKADRVVVKYSPMLDISLALKTLEFVSQVHIVSVENECKELIFILDESSDELIYNAVNLKKSGEHERFSFTIEDERNSDISYVAEVENYLYEPNASILKAGAFQSVAKKRGVKKLHKNSHLYTSRELIVDFPGRIFHIEKTFSPGKSNLKSFLQKTKKANIAVRNFPMSVAEIRKKTRLKEGGDIYLFATTLADERKVWIIGRKRGD